MRRDAKAVAESVKEGMSSDKAININKAAHEDLLSLPGPTTRPTASTQATNALFL